MKFGLRVAAFLLALVLLCSTLVGCAALTKPLNYLKDVVEKTVEKRFGGEFFEMLLSTLESGSVEVKYGGTDLYQTPLEAGEAKVYFDREKQKITAVGHVMAGGQKYDGKVFLTAKELVLCSTAFFGSTDLGVDFTTLEEDLKNSIFHNGSNTDFSRPEIGEDAAQDAIDLKNSVLSLWNSTDDILDLSDEVTEEFLEILTEYAPHSRYSEKGTVYISATVDNTVLSRTLRDTRARMVKDGDFRREIRELAAIKDRFASVALGLEVTEWSDKVEEFIASDIGINELCNKIDALPAFEWKLESAVDRSKGIIETAHISYSVLGVQLFAVGLDLTDKDTNVLTFTQGLSVRTLTYRVNKNGWNRYEAEMSYQKTLLTGEEVLLVTGALQADRKTDAFTLSLSKGEQTRVFTGSFYTKADSFSVSVDTATVNGETRRFALALTVKTDDKAEKLPAYTNLATVTEAQFTPISQRATAAREALEAAFGEDEPTWHALLACILTALGIEEEIPPPQSE